jgi:hypothetical protein
MQNPRYLTKSRFKTGLECSTKLFYIRKTGYVDNKLEDPFLAALAKGGFQVGELAKCHFPGGVNIDELDHETALQKTNELLQKENVIIYEAAFLYGTLFIRADILVKKGQLLELYEVKAKSADSADQSMTVKSGLPNSEWSPYLCDIAFQKYVVESSMPEYMVKAFLMVADKSVTASVDGLNQKFLLSYDEDGRTKVDVIGDVSPAALGNPLLCAILVDQHIDRIYAEPIYDAATKTSFKGLIDLYAKYYQADELLQGVLGAHCKSCEFKATDEEEANGALNGFKECWKRVHRFSDADFSKPSVLDIWNTRSKDKFIGEGRFFQSQITAEDLMPKIVKKGPVAPGMSASDRQILQVTKSNANDRSIYLDKDGMKAVFATFTYPLHFIDFETTAVAIPFHKGRKPYEQIAFQFSHHVVYEDGTIAHCGQWIDTEQGKFPNFDFLRALKKELDGDSGTIFRYAPHENTILNKIYQQLQGSNEMDKDELCDWIRTITKSTGGSAEEWEGNRNMVDLWELVKKYYYAPETNGSNSIKYVLPAVLNSSKYLQNKYSQPIYGSVIKSLNFADHAWIQYDSQGRLMNPYQLLTPIFKNVDMDMLDELLTSEEGEIRDGGAAMIAYAQMQFTQMSARERELITASLLRYCELDTFAMVMIWEEWQHQLFGKI